MPRNSAPSRTAGSGSKPGRRPASCAYVKDNGGGIAKKDQEKIFERFQQAGDILTDKPQGTGLGLPICRQILQRFGGAIWVESELGRGATFSFRVPLSGITAKPDIAVTEAAQ